MEKPVNDTSVGVFDVVTSLYNQQPADTPEEVIVTIQGVDILKDELPGWLFLKKSTDPRVRDAVSYAEEKARLLQNQSSAPDQNPGAGERVARSVEYLALNLLSRHWAHRKALREAYDAYRQQEGDRIDAGETTFNTHFG